MGISATAGVDLRKILSQEAERGPWRVRPQIAAVRDAVLAGESVSTGFARTGKCFPRLFREMVEVGEETGNLPEVLRRLADHYQHALSMRRSFVAGLVWPAFQLLAAILVVGLLIWIMGILAQNNAGQPIDLLGFGLIGTPGLVKYATIVGATVLVVVIVVWATLRGVFWTRPLQRAALFVPAVGSCLRTMALARMAWCLHLTMDVDMNLRKVLPLVLRSTGNDYYISRAPQIVSDIADGHEIHEAMRASRAFSEDFLVAVQVGEQSGQMSESMGRLSELYEEQARSAMAMLTKIAGFLIWAAVAGLIVFLIFRLASFYIGHLNDALNMKL
jgi:type IV pilus assembly protein PilC